jgi:transcriptional regulator with XRE-family HTH domain
MTTEPWKLPQRPGSIRLGFMSEHDESIGRRIAELREAAGMTQEDLAGKAGMATENLSRAERGRTTPHLMKLIGIADALGVTLDDIVRGETTKGAEVVRLVRRIEALDEETARRVSRVVNVLLDVLEADRRQ